MFERGQFPRSRHPFSVLSCFFVLSSLANAGGPAGRLETYTDPTGKSYFAILLRDGATAVQPQSIDLALVVDLSASQTGERRSASLALARAILDKLPAGSRVQVWTTRESVPLMPRPATVGSETLTAAMQTLDRSVPLGLSDLKGTLAAVDGWLADRSGSLPKTFLYLGDGMSTANPVSPEQVDALALRMLNHRAVAFQIPLGNQLYANPFQSLPSKTGGRLMLPERDAKFADKVAAALAAPVLVVDKFDVGPNVNEVFPLRLPPIRSDVETLIVGQWKPADSMNVNWSGARDGKADRGSITMAPVAGKADRAFLKNLFEQWTAAANEPAVFDGAASIGLAQANSARLSEGFLAQAKAALAERRLDAAEQFYRQALAVEPTGIEAKSGLQAVAQLKTGVDPRPPAPAPVPAAAANAAIAQPLANPGPIARPQADLGAAARPDGRDPLIEARDREKVEAQRLTRAVDASIREAQSIARTEPDKAMRMLKQTLATVESSVEVGLDRIEPLKRRLEQQLRTLSRQRAGIEMERIEQIKAVATVEARARQDNKAVLAELTTKELMNRYRSMFTAGDFAGAEAVAMTVRDKQPDELAAAAASQEAQLARHYAAIEVTNALKREKWWEALAQAEVAAIPFSDNVPIVFPDAKGWEEMTVRRRKYQFLDASPVSPSEEKIRQSLTRPISFDFTETPFNDVVDYFKEYMGVNIVIDKPGLEEAQVEFDVPITLELEQVTTKSALMLILQPLQLTYVIRDDVILITSQTTAATQLITKAYPVADLVMPINNFNSGGVGLSGALGGGNAGQGGLGGQGFGGFGGGGGQAGGGGQNFGVVPPNPNGGGGNQAIGGGANNLMNLIRGAAGNDGSSINNEAEIGRDVVKADDRQPQFDNGNSFALVAAEEVVKEKPAGKTDWDAEFKKKLPTDKELRTGVAWLLERNRHDVIVDMLRAYLRQQPGQPWIYSSLAMSLKIEGAEDQEVRDIILSPIDLSPNDPAIRLASAKMLVDVGQPRAALDLLDKSAATFPDSLVTYLAVLELAEILDDLDRVAWTAARILGREWSGKGEEIHAITKTRLSALEDRLRREKRDAEADRLRAIAAAQQERDLEIIVQWAGEADVDLYVVEPGDVLCSPATPRTVNGGVMTSDGVAPVERYVASEAFAGKYEVLLRTVWGMPTAGVATIDIIQHRGTPREVRQRHTLSLKAGANAILPIELAEGRRRELAPVGPEEAIVEAKPQAPAPGRALTQLRQLVATGAIDDPREVGTRGSFGAAARPVTGAGAIGFNPVLTVLNDGISMTAQAVISADRRTVRMSVAPVFQTIEGFRTVTVQGVAGGGFGGAGT